MYRIIFLTKTGIYLYTVRKKKKDLNKNGINSRFLSNLANFITIVNLV